MEESLTLKAWSCLETESLIPPCLSHIFAFPTWCRSEDVPHNPRLPSRAARFALGHVGNAVIGSDFLIQLRFTSQTFPGTNDNLSRAQQWHRLAPHLLTVGKHNCQRTEHWERQDCLEGEKK